jgi:hypothetical protein
VGVGRREHGPGAAHDLRPTLDTGAYNYSTTPLAAYCAYGISTYPLLSRFSALYCVLLRSC